MRGGLATVRRAPRLPLAIALGFVLVAVFGDLLAPHSPFEAIVSARLQPPFWMDKGSLGHPLGLDTVGRDVLSRIILGARVSLAAAVASILLGGGVGVALGLVSGYYRGWVDALVMRITDGMLSLPLLLLALLFAVALGPSFTNLIFVLALVMWARFARLVRGEVLSWREKDFVALARVAGAPPLAIMWRHLFPNILNSLVVLATLQVGWVIIVEASLSFLGAGIPPPTPSWGSMVAEGRSYANTAWWISVFPGIAIVLVVMSLNLLGDWLRDTLDPRQRQA
ncbi:MAG: ABC transporter permease [Chloroflexi bacterium]|nr:ABC transporter permease [Chloroflexota bacterium]